MIESHRERGPSYYDTRSQNDLKPRSLLIEILCESHSTNQNLIQRWSPPASSHFLKAPPPSHIATLKGNLPHKNLDDRAKGSQGIFGVEIWGVGWSWPGNPGNFQSFLFGLDIDFGSRDETVLLGKQGDKIWANEEKQLRNQQGEQPH